jgi:drug/metabolite transporter (DMT)-like permease
VVVLLALGSAVAYGISDFVGGMLARRISAWTVAVVAQCASTVCVTTLALATGGDPTRGDLAWGLLAGLGNGTGGVFLYRGLANGRMSVVAPLSAVGAALLPVVVGVATGERPSAITWLGVACAFPAIWLVSRSHDHPVSAAGARGLGVVDGLLAGLGFGLLFTALGQVPDSAGLQPLAVTQATSVVAIIALATLLRQTWLPRERYAWRAVTIGVLGAGATTLFLLATQAGLLSVASVLSSLYPAVTVLLAVTLLREHIHRPQAVGLTLALAAVALVAVG